jgi:hypothetical protein
MKLLITRYAAHRMRPMGQHGVPARAVPASSPAGAAHLPPTGCYTVVSFPPIGSGCRKAQSRSWAVTRPSWSRRSGAPCESSRGEMTNSATASKRSATSRSRWSQAWWNAVRMWSATRRGRRRVLLAVVSAGGSLIQPIKPCGVNGGRRRRAPPKSGGARQVGRKLRRIRA